MFNSLLGDVISVSGVLSVYSDDLELDGTPNDLALPYGYVTNSSGSNVTAALPTPIVMPLSLPDTDPGYVAQYLCGSLVTVSNVYFVDYTPTNDPTFANEGSYDLTNASSTTKAVCIYTGEGDGPDVLGTPIPQFAASVTGPLLQYYTPPGAYEINVTAISEIVTNAPLVAPQVTNLTASVSGGNITLSWTAVPTSYTYSVFSATNLAGPWVSLQGGLTFTNTSGSFTVGITNVESMFFQIDSP
jgi:hypothetical protein